MPVCAKFEMLSKLKLFPSNLTKINQFKRRLLLAKRVHRFEGARQSVWYNSFGIIRKYALKTLTYGIDLLYKSQSKCKPFESQHYFQKLHMPHHQWYNQCYWEFPPHAVVYNLELYLTRTCLDSLKIAHLPGNRFRKPEIRRSTLQNKPIYSLTKYQ